MKVLVATVGGTLTPIETAIDSLSPAHAAFICSQSSGANADSLVGRVKHAGGKAEKVLLQYEDDFEHCYRESLKVLSTLREAHPDADVTADYTGGTKTMSAALVSAAMDIPGVQLSLVTGVRFDNVRVAQGTQSLRPMQTGGIAANRLKRAALDSFARYDYVPAMALLREALAQPGLPADAAAELQHWVALARALDCWDRFQHVEAWNLLLNYRDRLTDLCKFLKAVMWSRACGDAAFTCDGLEGSGNTPKGHGYEMVEDLLLNAERRAVRGLYDDAVARLYRATELLAQIRLQREYGIHTGNVDLTNPKLVRDDVDWLRAGTSPHKKKVDVGLVRAYELLGRLNRNETEPLGRLYSLQYHKRIQDFLSYRNQSLLAHGCAPLAVREWKSAHDFFTTFLQDARGAMGLKPYAQPVQFPRDPAILTKS